MKIGDRNGVQDPNLGGVLGIDPRRPNGAEAVEDEGADQLEVSAYARALHRLVGMAKADGGEDATARAARVEELRGAVERGTYAPDPAAVARKLLLEEAI